MTLLLCYSLQVSFVQHFMGCQTCNAQNRNGDLESCQEGMFHSFNFTARYQAPMLRGTRPRSEADKSQLRELPYCSNNPTAHGCLGAKPVDAERQMQVEWVSHSLTLQPTSHSRGSKFILPWQPVSEVGRAVTHKTADLVDS